MLFFPFGNIECLAINWARGIAGGRHDDGDHTRASGSGIQLRRAVLGTPGKMVIDASGLVPVSNDVVMYPVCRYNGSIDACLIAIPYIIIMWLGSILLGCSSWQPIRFPGKRSGAAFRPFPTRIRQCWGFSGVGCHGKYNWNCGVVRGAVSNCRPVHDLRVPTCTLLVTDSLTLIENQRLFWA